MVRAYNAQTKPKWEMVKYRNIEKGENIFLYNCLKGKNFIA